MKGFLIGFLAGVLLAGGSAFVFAARIQRGNANGEKFNSILEDSI